jgi:Rad3-related DNA helicase/REP element-mobilizing transposase RayT
MPLRASMQTGVISQPVFLVLSTTDMNGEGSLVRVEAERVSTDGEVRRLDSLVRAPRLSLSQSRLTGLTNAQLDTAPETDDVLQELIEFSAGSDAWIVAAGNASRTALRTAAVSTGHARIPGPPLIGLDELSAVVLPTVGRRGLEDLQGHYGLKADAQKMPANDVDAETRDAELESQSEDVDVATAFPSDTPAMVRECFERLQQDLLKLPLPLLAEMNWLINKTEHPLKKMLKAAEAQAVKNQFADTFNSGKVSLDKLFKDFKPIIDRLLPDEDVAVGPPDTPVFTEPVTAQEITDLLGPSGPLSRALNGYEERGEQIEMAQRVGAALSEGKHLLAEAGTGVGKSLAYLVPAILFAQRAKRPVMIATHTKNLQSQLFHKDLPLLRKHLGVEFEAALLKGRPNYLCLRKFMYTVQESAQELDDEERAQMLPIMTWATQTADGDISEMSAFSREQNYDLWDRLHTVGDDCLKRQCPFYHRCFVYKARGAARGADVVVLNHALVFADLNMESGSLPPYSEIVFDEAHRLEDVATEHLACEVTPKRTYKILNRLYRTAQGSSAGKGLLPTLLMHLDQARSEFPEPLLNSIREHILNAMQAVDPANQGSDMFFNTIREWTEAPPVSDDDGPSQPFVPVERGRGGATLQPEDNSRFPIKRKRPSTSDERKRFSATSLRPDEVERFSGGKEASIATLGRLRQALDLLEEDFKEIRKRSIPRARELLKEIAAQNLFIRELIHDTEFVIKGEEPNYVYWSERWGRKAARVVAAPLDVAALLHEQLYDKKRSIIFASATLSVRDVDAGEAAGLAPYKRAAPPSVRRPGVPPGVPSNSGQIKIRKGGHLPHWTRDGGCYFVTFRLADALPASVVAELKEERRAREKSKVGAKKADSERVNRLYSEKLNVLLDAGSGHCWLGQPAITEVVSKSITHFNGDRYHLAAWCVMNNHVHAVLKPLGENTLESILHSWKSFSAKEANKLLRRDGEFWQEEYYDHLIRDEEDLRHCVEYTYFNPEKAGIETWQWRGIADEIQKETADSGRDARSTISSNQAALERPHPKSFEFLKHRLGLSLCAPDKLDELLLGSPFDFKEQCRLFVPAFLPEPGGFRDRDYSQALSTLLCELVMASGGRALVLYTSYAALEGGARVLKKMLQPEGIEVLAQGTDMSRESLLARLKAGRKTVVLGTASFWEGVDVRGDALSLLVIAKLPFAVFTDPIVQGRCELLEAGGKDSFLHFSVPHAILKLRQGFGRLIRSKTDRGVVVLADKRVLTKRYGAAFLRALPAQAHTATSQDALVKSVRDFLG